MLREFLFFLRALWREWRVLLTGGSVMALIAIWNLGGGRPIPQDVNWLIVGITLMLAAFFSWRTEWANAGQWFVDIDLKSLKQMLSGRTQSQAKQFVRRYIGKRLKLTGILSDIRESDFIGMFSTMIFLDLEDGRWHGGVKVSISVSIWDRSFKGISAFPQGTRVTVCGGITSLDSSWVSLSGCELIKAELPESPPVSQG